MQNTNYSHSPKRPDQNVRDTSKEAFSNFSHTPIYKAEWRITADALADMKEGTRRMLEAKTGFRPNKITQYAKMLLQKGIAIESPEKRPCQITGNKAYYLVFNSSNKEVQ